MIKNIVIALLAAACLGLAIFTVTRDDRKPVVPETANAPVPSTPAPVPPSEPELPPVAVPEPAVVVLPEPAIAEPAAKADGELLEDANGIIAMLIEENDDQQKELEKQKANNPFANLKKMMEDPEMRKTMIGSAEGQVEIMYAGFFERAGLDADTEEALSAMLLEHQAENMTLGLSMMGATKQERAKRALETEAKENVYKEGLREVLGEEGVAAFEQWEKEMPHRQLLKQATTNLRGENALSTKQEEELVQLMSLRNEELPGKGMDQFKPGDMPDKKTTETLLARQTKLTELYLQDAKVVLSESQHEAYAASMRQQQKMMEFGMRMGAQMFNTEAAEK